MSRKYYYVVLGSKWDLYRISYSDIALLNDAVYISEEVLDQNLLMKLHFGRINHFLNLPCKSVWNKRVFRNPFPQDRPLCFIFFPIWIYFDKETGFINYLKKHYPNSKFVWFLQDLYKVHPFSVSAFDLVLSYDKRDCEQYGFIYHHTIYSQKINIKQSVKEHYDVFFIGKAKGRTSQILKYFEDLSSNGLKCNFFVLGVPKNERIHKDKIHYIDELMPYSEVVQHVVASNCILEIMQEGAVGYTYRLWEAITFNKKLLTDNTSLLYDNSFYSPEFISIVENNQLSVDNIIFAKGGYKKENPFKKELSPVNLLDFIDTKLTETRQK